VFIFNAISYVTSKTFRLARIIHMNLPRSGDFLSDHVRSPHETFVDRNLKEF
jgi:hypothetical protein